MEARVDLHPDAAEDAVDDAHRDRVVVLRHDAQPSERMRVKMSAVPRVEPVGDHVFGLALELTPDDRVEETSRPLWQDGSLGGRFAQMKHRAEPNPREDPVIMGAQGRPAAMPGLT